MDDFDTFKASREKMDPSSRKFSESQWQDAYAAYRSSRKRLSGGGRSESGNSSKRRKKSSREGVARSAPSQNPIADLRNEVRQNSAYSDLRMMLDMLAWIAIGVAVVAAALKLAYYTNTSAALGSIMDAVFKIIAVVVSRLLAHVVIDIPDIALRNRLHGDMKAHKERDAGHSC